MQIDAYRFSAYPRAAMSLSPPPPSFLSAQTGISSNAKQSAAFKTTKVLLFLFWTQGTESSHFLQKIIPLDVCFLLIARGDVGIKANKIQKLGKFSVESHKSANTRGLHAHSLPQLLMSKRNFVRIMQQINLRGSFSQSLPALTDNELLVRF